MKTIFNILFLFSLSATINAQNTVNSDCINAIPLCTTPNFTFYAGSGVGNVNDIPSNSNISNPTTNPASSNSGCLLAGELNPQWLLVTVGNPGTLEFVFGSGTSLHPQVGFYDWAMWPYSPSTCSGIFNNTLPPIRCNWNASSSGGTGIASSINIPSGGAPGNYEPPLAVNGCQQYIICISNYSGVNTLVSFQSLGTASLSCSPSCLSVNAPKICSGSSASIIAVSSGGLSNIIFSLTPGGLTSPTPTFVINPSVNTTYTVYASGTNAQNASVTQSAITTVTVNPKPVSVPTSTQTTCTNTLNSFDLGLSFIPQSPVPGYTVSWASVPSGISNPTLQTSLTGGIPPGTYVATITAAGGCSVITSVTIDPTPAPAAILLNPLGLSHTLTCFQHTIVLNAINANYTYTWTNGLNAPITDTMAAFTSTMQGTWTITAINPLSGCVSTLAVVIGQNTVSPTSAITPTLQNITCNLTSVITITATANPSVNVTQQIFSPLGGMFSSTSYSAIYVPGVPGTYTHCAVNDANGCSTCKTFTVDSNQGFPTFTLQSPQNYTLGCTTTSIANINIVGAQGTGPGQVPNSGPVSYTVIGPPTSPNITSPPANLNTNPNFSVNVPGTWTVIVRDNTSFCETRVPISILSNTFAPDIDAIVPQTILDCYVRQTTLKGITTVTNTVLSWGLPGSQTQPGDTLTVYSNQNAPTNTLVGNYTLTIMDNSSTCTSTLVIPIRQNLYPPKALISGAFALSCITTSVTLTNQSSPGTPTSTGFPVLLPAIGSLWQGPTPQEPMTNSSTYLAQTPGVYTMTTLDLNNGCISSTTTNVPDDRQYPLVNNPVGPPTPTLDCGARATLSVTITNAPSNVLTYTWTGPPGTQFKPDEYVASPLIDLIGIYRVLVTNTINGCSATGLVSVINGTLTPDFEPDQLTGYAPLTVNFTNLSSSVNQSSITSVWNFGNGMPTFTASSVAAPVSALYTQAGTYTITLYARKGTCLESVQKVIKVELPSQLVIPNVFTPNNDGVNDFFFLKATNLSEISALIYDRWGHKVFEVVSDKGNIVWDGKNQLGKDVAEGTYFYVIKATGKDDKTYDYHGTVSLYR